MTLLSFIRARPSQLAALLTPARSSLRQAQNRFPQAQHRILRRSFAPLISLRACAAFSALALAKKQKVVMSAIVAIALMFPLGLSAQESAPHRLMAETVRLDANPASNPQLAIWRDKIPELLAVRKRLQTNHPNGNIQLIAEVFTTKFIIEGRTYYVSVINEFCGSSNMLEHSSYCPARVAEIVGEQARIIQEIPDFIITSLRGESGFDASSNAQKRFMTLAVFHPTTRTITFTGVDAGESNPLGVTVHIP